MKTIIAKDIGFCWGVRRALDLALQSSTKARKVYTYGPLIHNQNVVELLKAKGVEPFPSRRPKTNHKILLVIRAHGVPPSIRKKLEDKGMSVVDATCPHVKKSQKLVQTYARKGFQIIIAGDREHAEVVSLVGYARDMRNKSNAIIISSVKEARTLFAAKTGTLHEKICILAQSTFQPRLYKKIVEVFQRKVKKGTELVILNTICHAPSRRQDAVKDLAHQVNAIIVVGDHKSANTTNLTLLARSFKIPAFQVASASELPLMKLKKYKSIGITTGTSTPDSDIKAVIERISEL